MFKIIAELGSIPDGSVVRKISGSKEFTVRRTLRIFAESADQRREIKCDSDCVFIVDGSGDVSMYSRSKEVCWMATEDDIRDLLDPISD